MCNNNYQTKILQHQISNYHNDNRQSHINTVIFVDKVKLFEQLFKGN
jgi:hypothetical protein